MPARRSVLDAADVGDAVVVEPGARCRSRPEAGVRRQVSRFRGAGAGSVMRWARASSSDATGRYEAGTRAGVIDVSVGAPGAAGAGAVPSIAVAMAATCMIALTV